MEAIKEKIEEVYNLYGNMSYKPLSLISKNDKDEKDDKEDTIEMRTHYGGPNKYGENVGISNSLITYPEHSECKAKVAVCITVCNEKYLQLVLTLAGVYRAYYNTYKLINKINNNVCTR